jgi:hypothetical protein
MEDRLIVRLQSRQKNACVQRQFQRGSNTCSHLRTFQYCVPQTDTVGWFLRLCYDAILTTLVEHFYFLGYNAV